MVIYLITNKINGKRYVGQTINVLEVRWKSHLSDFKNGKEYPLYLAMKKHGIENFAVKILAKCNTIDELNHRETYYIRLLNTHVSKERGYNIRLGGMNAPLSEIHKKKIGDAQRGISKPNHTEESKRKISEANRGVPKTKEHKLKLAEANTGVSFTEERKENLSKAWVNRQGKEEFLEKFTAFGKKKSKPIFCNENGITYPSIHAASRELGLFRQHIKRVLLGQTKQTKGYTFRWAI